MSDDRRARILVAARDLLRQQTEVRDITIGNVAAAAHVGRATVYRYFPNKAALLRAATSTNGTQSTPLEPRARILEAALDLLAERGPHATTLSEIASRAGLSLSGLHWYFKSKDELIAAVAQYLPILPTLMAELLQATAQEANLDEQLTHIAEVVLSVFERRRGLVRFAIFEAAIYPDVARLGSTHTIGRFLPVFAELFEQHARRGTIRSGSAQARAQAFMGMFMLLALLRPAFDSILAPDDRDTAREYVQIMLRGVLADPKDTG